MFALLGLNLLSAGAVLVLVGPISSIDPKPVLNAGFGCLLIAEVVGIWSRSRPVHDARTFSAVARMKPNLNP